MKIIAFATSLDAISFEDALTRAEQDFVNEVDEMSVFLIEDLAILDSKLAPIMDDAREMFDDGRGYVVAALIEVGEEVTSSDVLSASFAFLASSVPDFEVRITQVAQDPESSITQTFRHAFVETTNDMSETPDEPQAPPAPSM